MFRLRPAFLATFCVLAVQAAVAATLTHQSGDVLVNLGSGFQPLTVPAEIPPGTQMMVRPGGSAFMKFANGCEIQVGPGSVWVVPQKPPCGELRKSSTEPANGTPKDGPPPPAPGNATWFVTPLIVAGGGAAAIMLLTQGGGDDSKPISP